MTLSARRTAPTPRPWGSRTLSKYAAGLLMEKELEYLGRARRTRQPFVAILGGAKVSDKIGVIQNLMKGGQLIIGGGMAYTFLKAQGQEIGKSLLEADKLELAKQSLAEAKAHTSNSCCRSTMWSPTKWRRTRASADRRRPADSGRQDGARHWAEDD